MTTESTAGSGDAHGPRVTIACQGGGSHTAFTAGVLDRLLAEDEVGFDVVGLTGTSGGAICAFVTWYALASEGRVGGRATARERLAAVWDDLAARDPVDGWANAVGVGTARAAGAGLPLPTASPYGTPVADWSRERLRETLERAVDPDDLATLVERVRRGDVVPPRLEVGAADVQRGTFRTFTERDVSHDAVLASAAVPTLFRAAPVVGADGATRYYWDGLFSQNPPLGELRVASEGRLDRADELWIVQINPRRDEELPRTIEAIADRRNELGGNLSVNQELATIRELNGWYAEGALGGTYRPIRVRTIDVDEAGLSPGRPLDYASKLDRSPGHLERLWEHGRARAGQFLAVERDRRRVARTVAATWGDGPPMGRRVDREVAPVRPDAVVHLPTSLLELRRYLSDEPEAAEPSVDWGTYRAFADDVRGAITDLRIGVEEAVAEPTRVAFRWRGTGVHDGPLAGVEPTGRPVTLSGMSLYRLVDGAVAEAWVLTEQWSLLRQLAVAAPTAPLSTASRVSATPVVTELSAPAENAAIVREEVAAVWNEGDREAADRLVDPDVRTHFDDGSDPLGRDAYWRFVRRYREAFPDLDVTVADAVSEGDKVVLRLRLRGTHEGPFLGVEPTGRHVDVARMAIYHLDDGRIVESGLVEDTVRLVHQLDAPAREVAP